MNDAGVSFPLWTNRIALPRTRLVYSTMFIRPVERGECVCPKWTHKCERLVCEVDCCAFADLLRGPNWYGPKAPTGSATVSKSGGRLRHRDEIDTAITILIQAAIMLRIPDFASSVVIA
jgi:hypothetical protein